MNLPWYEVSLFALAAHSLGALHAVHAILHARSAQASIAWAVSLVTFPYLAIPLYWVFGRSKFFGYVEARRAGRLAIHQLARDARARLQPFRPAPTARGGDLQLYESLAGLPLTGGNRVRLLVDGEATFASMLEAIDQAREYVVVQFFIVHGDRIGQELKDALLRVAARGVRVFFLYDALGSTALPHRYVAELRAAGIEAHAFRGTRGWRTRVQLNFRNHRKITIVDGRTAFLGGLNVGDEYLGRSRRFGHWRDTHLRIDGPAVQCVQLAFVEDWYWTTGRVPALCWEPAAALHATTPVLVLPTGPADELEPCQLFLVNLIHSARERLWITSPYFIPDAALAAALQLAALRGVDVRLMLPSRPDHLLVYLSGFSYARLMLDAGVKVYRYQSGFLHQKVILVDDRAATVGTVNLDNRSVYLNFEITALVPDPAFAAEAAAMLTRDFAACHRVTIDELRRQPWWFQVATRAARLMAPVQ